MYYEKFPNYLTHSVPKDAHIGRRLLETVPFARDTADYGRQHFLGLLNFRKKFGTCCKGSGNNQKMKLSRNMGV